MYPNPLKKQRIKVEKVEKVFFSISSFDKILDLVKLFPNLKTYAGLRGLCAGAAH